MEESAKQFEADQAEIRLLVWQNKIPVKLILSPMSVSSDREPLPFYTFFQRVHHPIFYFKLIHEFFEKFAPVPRNASDIWLEWDGQPINWNIPFGLTFDLNYVDESVHGEFHNTRNTHSNQSDNESENSVNDSNNSNLNSMPFYPVTIVVHYGPSPKEILAIESATTAATTTTSTQIKDVISVANANFKFNLKEALLIRNQTTFVLTQVNLNEQELFLTSFLTLDDKMFFPILDVIFSTKTISVNNHPIRLPLRVYIRNYPGRIQLVETILTGEERLGDLLVRILPKTLKMSDSEPKQFELVSKERASEFKVLCNGVSCNLAMPLLYFYKHFFHYDGFTYLAIQI